MSKSATPGELRTKITVKSVTRTINENGFPSEVETVELTTYCKWVNFHGNESFTQNAVALREPATLTTRFSSALLDPKLLIYRESETDPFEIISIDNVQERNTWLEIKVQRKVAAK